MYISAKFRVDRKVVSGNRRIWISNSNSSDSSKFHPCPQASEGNTYAGVTHLFQ